LIPLIFVSIQFQFPCFLCYAGAIVVTVPPEPRHFNAPASTKRTPPLVGFTVGTVVQFCNPTTRTPSPNSDVVCSPVFPFASILMCAVVVDQL
jgi:hypothetical protein